MGVFSFPRFIRLVLHSGFPHRSRYCRRSTLRISASLQYTTSHFVKSPFIPSLLVRYQSGDNRGDNRVDNWTLKAFNNKPSFVFLLVLLLKSRYTTLRHLMWLLRGCLPHCVINWRALLSTSSNTRAPSFFLACLRSLVTVSIGALLISFHINVSCLTSVQSRNTCQNPLRPVINKVYQQGVSTRCINRLETYQVAASYGLISFVPYRSF